MTREEIVSLLLHLLPPAKNGGSDLRIALTEILRRASVANVLALQYAMEGLQKTTRIDNHESRPYHSPAVSVEN